LSGDLEKCVLYAAMQGLVPLETIHEEELSKQGRVVLGALKRLLVSRGNPPFTGRSVYLVATDVLGADRREIKQFIKSIEGATVGEEVEDVLKAVRDKETLVEVANAEIGRAHV